MDDDKEDEEKLPPVPQLLFFIKDLDAFIADVYLNSFINFDVMMLPQIHNLPNGPFRDKLKANFISEMYLQGVDPKTIEEMKKLYPLEKATEVIKQFIVVDAIGNLFVLASELHQIYETVSNYMIYAIYEELARQGKVELCWYYSNWCPEIETRKKG
jgi:hypothetical protein